MYDPTFSATNAHLNDIDRAAAPRLRDYRADRSKGGADRAGTLIAISLIGVVVSGVIALQGMVV